MHQQNLSTNRPKLSTQSSKLLNTSAKLSTKSSKLSPNLSTVLNCRQIWKTVDSFELSVDKKLETVDKSESVDKFVDKSVNRFSMPWPLSTNVSTDLRIRESVDRFANNQEKLSTDLPTDSRGHPGCCYKGPPQTRTVSCPGPGQKSSRQSTNLSTLNKARNCRQNLSTK